MYLRKAIRKLFKSCGYSILRFETHKRLKIRDQILKDFAANNDKWRILLLSALSEETGFEALKFLPKSKGQLYQDIFALGKAGLKRGGYFVEFGAADGVKLSNTYLLEKTFGWKGILAEPAGGWFPALPENRDAITEKLCLWSKTGETVTFNETPIREFSTIDALSDSDHHGERRQGGVKYDVPTISLTDLLKKHKAPRYIDYLSIDTEGSELEILQAFDFSRWTFGTITVEHNHGEQRAGILELLTTQGYVRWRPDLTRFDDWYVNQVAPRRA
jgi:FkbM family methyltransferase